MNMMRAPLFLALASLTFSGAALAQGNSAYKAAKAAGEIGERVDGYVGIVGRPTTALQNLVNDINIKRKAIYVVKGPEKNATPEQYALTTGCALIAITKPGEKYLAPDGSWKTRTSAPPDRLPQCP